VSMLIYICSIF